MNQDKIIKRVESHPYLCLSEIVFLPTKELAPHPERNLFPEISPDQKELLTESIKNKGILHNLVVTERGLLHDNKYTILSGHTRWEIASSLGLEKVPCRIVSIKSEVKSILSQEDIYNLFLDIFIEANLAQRILDPYTFMKCSERKNQIVIRGVNDFSEELIPEFKEALKEKKLPIQLARAIAKFSLEEQRKFLALIGGKYGRIQNVDMESLKETLKQERAKLAAASRQIEELRRSNAELQKRIQALSEAKAKDERALQLLVQEKRGLMRKLEELERRLPSSNSLPPEVVSQIENLKKTITAKEKEIQSLQKKLFETEKETENIKKQLRQEKEKAQKEIKKAQEEFKKQLEKIRAQKEKSTKETITPQSRDFYRYKVFMESILAIFDEIRGDNDLSEAEKKELVQLLSEVIEAARMTQGTLEGKSPADVLGISGNGLLDEDGYTLNEPETQSEEISDLFEEIGES